MPDPYPNGWYFVREHPGASIELVHVVEGAIQGWRLPFPDTFEEVLEGPYDVETLLASTKVAGGVVKLVAEEARKLKL